MNERSEMNVGLTDKLEPSRAKMHPAVQMVAVEICTLGMTDGFCGPRNCGNCEKCWPRAEKLLLSSGFSARALVWILRHRARIEKEAAEGSNV